MKQLTLNCAGQIISLEQPILMGILNATPDSFYSKSRTSNSTDLLAQTEKMITEGATILDIGGMSSRPGADEVSVQEELDRVLPAIETIHTNFPETILSIDTYRAEVAEQAIQHGVSIINDISGSDTDHEILAIAAQYHTPYICMHMQGLPKTMQQNPNYEDVTLELIQYFNAKLSLFEQYPIHDIILDVGFGFGKSLKHNYQLLNQLHTFSIFEKPLLVGLSRKSMICKPLHCSPDQALNGTTALHMIALQQGVNILRVHDVKEAAECITLHQQIVQNNRSDMKK
jgi:dihydropteroate synthase